ncbi:MAG: four helix bundle protein [Spirochaetaceae bacterium]|jgi:four helix bundle protein|nr:four helix bundle protein [Spirochaetaceae bacterium]
MVALKSFKELIVWQESVNLVEMIYRHTQTFPEDEKFGLVSQTRRAAISIPANIAEGYGRSNRKEYLHFLGIANGSLTELETHLIIAERIMYVTKEDIENLEGKIVVVSKLLRGLRKSLSPLP